MFNILDDIADSVIKTTAKVVSPVTEAFGVSGKTVATLLAAGYTVYEISELTGLAVSVIENMMEG